MASPPPPYRREDTIHLTPYTGQNETQKPINHPYGSGSQQGWSTYDPRSSSTQSLRPEGSIDGKRTLLLIYVHGFLGNETSFKSFPAHVHNLLTITLAETHVVHSKIYPRYKSRKPIEYARDDFSNCVVGTGIMSLFRSSPERPVDNAQHLPTATSPGPLTSPGRLSVQSDDELSRPPSNDPNFNPSFTNDIHIPQRSGFQKALYFVNKHSGGLTSATKEYLFSHLEFGGCLADYQGLKRRYNKIRSLEDVDDQRPKRDEYGRQFPRVRFINYYSASTGRRKPDTPDEARPIETEMKDMSLQPRASAEGSRASRSPSPSIRISGEVPREDDTLILLEPMPEPHSSTEPTEDVASAKPSISSLDDTTMNETTPTVSTSNLSQQTSTTNLPAIPPTPSPPPPLDESKYPDKDDLKFAQKDHARQLKAYQRLQKDREKSLRDREKLIRKREKAALKAEEKQQKLASKEAAQRAKIAQQNHDITRRETLKRQATLNPELYDRHLEREAKAAAAAPNASPSSPSPNAPRKKLKDRKFCALPPKASDGSRDNKWVRVYMDGVDEVVAHTTLFEPSETYERLVGDTAARIEEWVAEERTRVVLRGEEEERGKGGYGSYGRG
ncbi:MAG: hypothetical protein Q9160_001459 [Pyrenula sp. 1 TL-2023]